MAAPRRRPNLSALRREIAETRGTRWLHRRHQALLCELQEAEAAATTPGEAAAEEEATDASPPPAKRRRRSSAESDSEEEEEEEEEEGPEAAALTPTGKILSDVQCVAAAGATPGPDGLHAVRMLLLLH